MAKKVFVALRMAGIAGQEKLSGIFRYLGDSRDWDMTLVRTESEFTPERMREALNAGFNGFIVSIPNTEKTTTWLADSDVPTVVIDLHDPALMSRRTNIAFIRNSPEEIGRSAASLLLSTGRCRSYAFVQDPTIAEWSVDRFRAFRDALRERGLRCHELGGPQELVRLERPVGVFTANDDRGYDTLEYCRAKRIRVPDDMLVLGTNNDTLICENCRPTLSSVQPDFNEEGYLAAKVLAKMMARHRKPAAANQQPTTLFVGVKAIVRRGSTSEISQAGKLVQKALAYIRKNASRGIGVDDVVRHLGCSRRLADLRFQELQGMGIGQMITATRLSEVQRLLKATGDPIGKIAADCGYDNPNSLKNLFKREVGMTMRDFRTLSRHSGAPQSVNRHSAQRLDV